MIKKTKRWIGVVRTARKHKLKQRGIVNPLWTVSEAHRAKLDLALACAFLEQESGGGHNVFGHDPVSNPVKGGKVTKKRYLLYKYYRKLGRGMQGVGPMQLTWFSYQDAADAKGGCWKPKYNMRVGFKLVKDLIAAHGEAVGIARYNGSGAAAEAYSVSVRRKRAAWRHRFSRD